MKPRFNICAKGLGLIHMENLYLTKCWENIQAKCSLYRGIVNDEFQRPAFPDLNNF